MASLTALGFALGYMPKAEYERLTADMSHAQPPLLADALTQAMGLMHESWRHPGPSGLMYIWICLPMANILADEESAAPDWLRSLSTDHPVLVAMTIGLCLGVMFELLTGDVTQLGDSLRDLVANQAGMVAAMVLYAAGAGIEALWSRMTHADRNLLESPEAKSAVEEDLMAVIRQAGEHSRNL